MKQGIWSALLVSSVIIALALGFLGGQVWKGSSRGDEALRVEVEKLGQQLNDLQGRIAALEQAASSASSQPSQGGLRIAYVDMFQVLQDLQESELVKSALEKFRQEQQKIEQQIEEWRKKFDNGEITKKQLDEKLNELKLQLNRINLELSAPIQQRMLEVIRQIGKERGYGLIIDNPASQLNAIVLYSQSGEADDITQEVVSRLKAQLEQGGGEGSNSGNK